MTPSSMRGELRLDRPANACRLCGATTRQKLLGVERAADLGQSLYVCGHCGGGYLDPEFAPEVLDLFYRSLYRKLFTAEAARHHDEAFLRTCGFRAGARDRAMRIMPEVPQGGRILEVGSGYGAFFAAAHVVRPDVFLYGIEPDEAHRTAGTAGAPVIFVEDVAEAGRHGPFDLIVLFHVLEHVSDPVGSLRRLSAMLSPGGRIVIEVPDMQAPWSSWFDIHPAHLSYLTRPSLDRLLFRAGLADRTQGLQDGNGVLWAVCGHRDAAANPPPAASGSEIDAWQGAGERYRLNASITIRRRIKMLLTAALGPERVGALQRTVMRWRLASTAVQGKAGSGRIRFFDAPLDPLTADTVLTHALEAMRSRKPFRHGDLNVAKLIEARNDPILALELEQCDLVCPDGMGIILAARLLGLPLPERVTGIDLMERLMGICAEHGLRPFILGAKQEVLEAAVARLISRHPQLEMAGIHHGYFQAHEEGKVVAEIRASKADCLFVAMPSPRKEVFLGRYHKETGVPFVMGVGGSVDVIAGLRRRAPRWMQRAGLEWVARMVQEPRRLGPRYLMTNSAFFRLVAFAMLGRLCTRYRT